MESIRGSCTTTMACGWWSGRRSWRRRRLGVSSGLMLRISIKKGAGMGSKHTGEDDSRTDHVGKGSDGHTTESGKDK
jgi:hypothetical protein